MKGLFSHSKVRRVKIRVKRLCLGRSYRHMAKVSRHLFIDEKTGVIYWKRKHICDLVMFDSLLSKHSNETVFIIASGPSLKNIDISVLDQAFTIGVNGSILKFYESGIAPDYYVISDEEFVYNRSELVKKILETGFCHCFFTPQVISAVCEISPDLLLNHPRITVFHNHFKKFGEKAMEYEDIVEVANNDSDIVTEDGRIGFSLNPAKGVFTASTVTYFALQIAYGLGFRIFNLVGMDLGSPNGKTRFYETGVKAMPSHLDRDYFRWILPSFKIVAELCQDGVIAVFNLSPVSRLPANIIPKKDFSNAVFELNAIENKNSNVVFE